MPQPHAQAQQLELGTSKTAKDAQTILVKGELHFVVFI